MGWVSGASVIDLEEKVCVKEGQCLPAMGSCLIYEGANAVGQ